MIMSGDQKTMKSNRKNCEFQKKCVVYDVITDDEKDYCKTDDRNETCKLYVKYYRQKETIRRYMRKR